MKRGGLLIFLFGYAAFILFPGEGPSSTNPNAGASIDLEHTLSSLENQLSASSLPSERREILLSIAHLQEFAGNLDAAQKAYERSFHEDASRDSYAALFSSAALLFEMGEWERARFQAEFVESGAPSSELKALAANLAIRCLIENDEIDEAASRFASCVLIPEMPARSLYAFYGTAFRLGLDEQAKALADMIVEKHPDSVEAMLMKGLVSVYPSPYCLFYHLPAAGRLANAGISPASSGQEAVSVSNAAGAARSPRVFVQIGSFRDRENAEYRKLDAEKAGLKAEIVEAVVNGTRYFRLVVPTTPELLQQTLLMVKGKGFDGYPLYTSDGK